MQFQTPLVCHPDSLLVYPILSETLQHRWDQIHTELKQDILTEQVRFPYVIVRKRYLHLIIYRINVCHSCSKTPEVLCFSNPVATMFATNYR